MTEPVPCPYDDAGYANERLGDTVVRLLNGELVFVSAVESMSAVRCFRLTDMGRNFHCRLTDIDISPLPLGWSLYGLNCDFLMRRPCRRYKQGTNWNNLIGPRLDYIGGRSTKAYSILVTPVMQVYPDWNTALQMVEDIYSKVPLTRDFAVDSNRQLWYKSFACPVGQINRSDQRVYLEGRYNHLAEVVEETLDHQAVIGEH